MGSGSECFFCSHLVLFPPACVMRHPSITRVRGCEGHCSYSIVHFKLLAFLLVPGGWGMATRCDVCVLMAEDGRHMTTALHSHGICVEYLDARQAPITW